jgi:hypothetical protein
MAWFLPVRCKHPGCRSWALRGNDLCRSHAPTKPKNGGAPAGNHNAASPGSRYSQYLSVEEQALVALDPDHPGLDGEIDIARVLVVRALKGNDLVLLSRAVLIVARLLESKRRLEGDQAAGIVAAITQIINELTPPGGTI